MAIRLDTSNPLANFRQETLAGQKFFPTPTVLTVQDIGDADVNLFIGTDADAAAGAELDLVISFDVSTFIQANADTGVRFVINDGIKAACLCCIIKNGVQGLGIAGGPNFTDPDNYPVFVPVNWSAPTTVRFRRTAAGEAELLEVNGVAPSPRALLQVLAPASHPGEQTIEFGCAGVEAQATMDVSALFCERPPAGKLTPTVLRIRDSDSSDQLRFRADFALSGSGQIDPVTQPVKVTLSCASTGTYYSKTIAGFEVKGQAPRRRWLATPAALAASGIERCVIDEDPNNTGSFFLRDVATTVATGDFTTTTLEVTIGTDACTGGATLVERPVKGGTKWRLKTEP